MRTLAIAALLLSAAPTARAFEQVFDAPGFVVSVPRIPDLQLVETARESQAATAAVHARGKNEVFTVEVTAEPSGLASSTRTCAGTFLRDLVKRPNMPDRDNIYRAPFDSSTFLVLYILELQGTKVLHAHLLSAAAGTHCIEAHFSRDMATDEDEDQWRMTFAGSSIRERRK